jgi:hypothetical protein
VNHADDPGDAQGDHVKAELDEVTTAIAECTPDLRFE